MAISKIPSAGFQDNVKFRNLIINGGMDLAQRGTSTSGITSNGYYTVDRMNTVCSLGTWTQSQSTDVPSGQGFTTSLKMDCTTADASPSSGDSLRIRQIIEGQNLQYLKKGTANAESLTLSFWVKSNKTGTYIFEVFDQPNGRHINKSYTISSANTWEKKTITFPGDTTGTLNNDNSGRIRFEFYLSAGSDFTSGTLQTSWGSRVDANRAVGQVNLADSTSNEWYVTGVQLEAGQTASEFEFLPVDVNLKRCERYYQIIATGNSKVIATGTLYTSTTAYAVYSLKGTMRTTPSLDQISGSNYFNLVNSGGSDYFTSFALNTNESHEKILRFNNAQNISATAGQSGWFQNNASAAVLAAEAEL